MKLFDLGVPTRYCNWIKNFLNNRTGHVKFEDVNSKTRKFKAGVPQGSVISPLLFLVYVNDIVEGLPNEVQCSLFADDLALWVSNNKIDDCIDSLQAGLNIIDQWTTRWKMSINVSKCECVVFTREKAQLKIRPNLAIINQTIPYNGTPKFLGVTFDPELTFKDHVKNIVVKCKSRINIVRALSGTNWGCNNDDLRLVYLTYIRSLIDYCGASWLPNVSDSNANKLEIVQTTIDRIITGCVNGTNNTHVLKESKILPIAQRQIEHAAVAIERYKRLPDDNPTKHVINKKTAKKAQIG